jgi:hypothetical protein
MKWNGRKTRIGKLCSQEQESSVLRLIQVFRLLWLQLNTSVKKYGEGTILVTYEHLRPQWPCPRSLLPTWLPWHVHSQERREEVHYERLEKFEGT